MPKTCAVLSCFVGVPKQHLMCVSHWRKVSPQTQRLVFSTLHAFQGGRLGLQPYSAAVVQAVKEATS